MKHRIIIFLICVLALFLTACVADEPKDPEPSPQISAGSENDIAKFMNIETAYATLNYPKEWEDYVKYESGGEGDNIVEFYATVGQHERVHIFDVQFGGESGYCIGVVEKDGTETEVNVVSYDVSFDEAWTGKEINTILAMQEDINFLIQNLNEK